MNREPFYVGAGGDGSPMGVPPRTSGPVFGQTSGDVKPTVHTIDSPIQLSFLFFPCGCFALDSRHLGYSEQIGSIEATLA